MLTIYSAQRQKDLEDRLFQLIGNSLADIRSGRSQARRVLLIVPAQTTMKAEQEAFARLGDQGFLDLHIMSGNRLIQQILRECGGPGLTPVSSLGKSLLMRRTAARNASMLSCYGKLVSDRGFIDMAGKFMDRLRQSCLKAEDVAAMRDLAEKDSLLYAKLSDMQLLAEGYQQAMDGRFTDQSDLMAFAISKMPECSFVKDALIWYYDFYSFTEAEQQFLMGLERWSRGLGVMLLSSEGGPKERELFASPMLTAGKLRELCSQQGRDFAQEKIHGQPHKKSRISVIKCASAFNQAETMAVKILDMVRRSQCDFSGIGILTSDNTAEQELIARVFKTFGIPVFMDSKRSVSHTPAAELTAALLDTAADGYKADSIIRLIKTGLVQLPEGGSTEIFEKYLRQYHIKGKAFTVPFKYGRDVFEPDEFEQIEAIRASLHKSLETFTRAMAQASDAEGKCRALYEHVCNDLGAVQTLEQMAAELSEEGMPDASEESLQSWNAVAGLMDQIVELMGGEEMSTAEFRDIFTASLADIRIGVLPQAEGRVHLGTVTRSRIPRLKALFIPGFNEGSIPAAAGSGELLTDREQDLLRSRGYSVYKDRELLAAEERLLIHNLLDQDADEIWLCWCAADLNGDSMKASPLLLELMAEDPSVCEYADAANSGDPLVFLQGRQSTLGHVAEALRTAIDQGNESELSELWKAGYNLLLSEGGSSAASLKQALSYTGAAADLDPGVAEGLFARRDSSLVLSSSAMEQYARCPFRHFVERGLRPAEDRDFVIDRAKVGSIHHDAVMKLAQRLSEPSRQRGEDISSPGSLWLSVTQEQLGSMLDEILEEMASTGFDGIMKAGDAEEYKVGRIKRVCMDFALQMVDQVRRGRIIAMDTEAGFGRGRAYPAIEISSDRGKVYIEGRIDRVDLLRTDSGDYVKIIDYKSGSSSFERDKVEQGLSLQLMTYLEAASAGGEAKPAGVFYFLIRDIYSDGSADDLAAERLSDQLAEKLRREYALDGMVINDPGVLGAIDRDITDSGSSLILGYKTQKDGKVKCRALIEPEDFEKFRDAFRSNLERICKDLYGGRIAAEPAASRDKADGCAYCPYGSICLKALSGKQAAGRK